MTRGSPSEGSDDDDHDDEIYQTCFDHVDPEGSYALYMDDIICLGWLDCSLNYYVLFM